MDCNEADMISAKFYGRAEGGDVDMPGVRVSPDEPIELAIKRFRKQVERGGVISECRRREAYQKPSIARKHKEAAARKRLMKRLRRVRMRENREY